DREGREFMAYIVNGAARMKRLIDDLLTYSRAGRPDGAMRAQSLDKVLDEALANLEHAIGETDARIVRPQALPTLACNEAGMTQLLQNLIANAIKFRAGTPVEIRIEAKRDGADWVFSVTDNGIGIDSRHFDRIFMLFQRLHPPSAYEGTGIGLSICKRIVERHGGKIWVESEPGEGTSFKFKLPAATR
ncbi:MAG: ATP-binding protein, partial [Ramlibacter sp.]